MPLVRFRSRWTGEAIFVNPNWVVMVYAGKQSTVIQTSMPAGSELGPDVEVAGSVEQVVTALVREGGAGRNDPMPTAAFTY